MQSPLWGTCAQTGSFLSLITHQSKAILHYYTNYYFQAMRCLQWPICRRMNRLDKVCQQKYFVGQHNALRCSFLYVWLSADILFVSVKENFCCTDYRLFTFADNFSPIFVADTIKAWAHLSSTRENVGDIYRRHISLHCRTIL